MRRVRRALCGAVLALFAVSSVGAQELSEICPNSPPGTGALWGVVADAEAEVALPGAKLVASWRAEGKPVKAEVQTGVDGSYTLCYLPLETVLAVQPALGNMPGAGLTLTLTQPLTNQDIAFSLGGAAAGGEADDRIWACFGRGESQLNMQNSRLIRCDANWRTLERCPKVELGRAQVTASGGGSGMLREAVEEMVQQARRLGANALINWSQSGNTLSAEAVKIEVDPSTCT